MTREDVKKILGEIDGIYREFTTNQKCYANSIVSFVFGILSSLIVPVHSVFCRDIFILAIIYLMAAICCDINTAFIKIKDNLFGKGLIAVIFALSINFSIALSQKIVNDITGVDPSKFPHTVAIVSILGIPFAIVVGGVVLNGISLLFGSLALPFGVVGNGKLKEYLIPGYSQNAGIKFKKITLLVQVIGAAVFGGFVLGVSMPVMPSYEGFIKDKARSFLFEYEMYEKYPCDIESQTRAAPVGDGNVLIGTQSASGIIFNVRECKGAGKK